MTIVLAVVLVAFVLAFFGYVLFAIRRDQRRLQKENNVVEVLPTSGAGQAADQTESDRRTA